MHVDHAFALEFLRNLEDMSCTHDDKDIVVFRKDILFPLCVSTRTLTARATVLLEHWSLAHISVLIIKHTIASPSQKASVMEEG